MSTTTVLAACDHTLSDPDLLNCMCILTIAWGDGIPFDANSLQEDIVELCVGVGQAWLSATDSFCILILQRDAGHSTSCHHGYGLVQ